MIKSWGRALALLLLILTFVVAFVMAMAWLALPPDGVTVTVDGRSFTLAELAQGPRALVFFVVAVAAVVLAIAAAFVMVIVGLAFGVLGIAFGLLTAIASLALVASPFVLVGWLLWRLLREPPAPAPAHS